MQAHEMEIVDADLKAIASQLKGIRRAVEAVAGALAAKGSKDEAPAPKAKGKAKEKLAHRSS